MNSQNNLSSINSVIDKNLLTKILIQLCPYLLESSLNDQDFENYISFAIDIYNNILKFDADLDNKIKTYRSF